MFQAHWPHGPWAHTPASAPSHAFSNLAEHWGHLGKLKIGMDKFATVILIGSVSGVAWIGVCFKSPTNDWNMQPELRAMCLRLHQPSC